MKLKASPFAWVSFAMIVGVMGTALISPLYALYKDAWLLQASDVSLIYVLYMGGALCGLLFLGRLPDRVGFRPCMQWGLALGLTGTFICMIAPNMLVLSVGRILVGISSSILITSSTLGLAMLSPNVSAQRVAMTTGFLMAFGFGLGPLIGGAMGQWAPYPLITTYLLPLILGGIGFIVLSRLQLPTTAYRTDRTSFQWRNVMPHLTWPESTASGAFALTSSLPFLAFGVFGLYASMSPLFLDKLVPWHGPVVSGTAIAVILLASACIQIPASRLPTRWCGSFGLVALALSNAFLMANLWAGSAVLFALGVIATALGHAMCMLGGMSMVNRLATSGNRSGLLATYLVIGYMGSMVPMMGVGWLADHWGMNVALCAFCTMVIVLGSAAAVLFQRHPLMRAA